MKLLRFSSENNVVPYTQVTIRLTSIWYLIFSKTTSVLVKSDFMSSKLKNEIKIKIKIKINVNVNVEVKVKIKIKIKIKTGLINCKESPM